MTQSLEVLPKSRLHLYLLLFSGDIYPKSGTSQAETQVIVLAKSIQLGSAPPAHAI